MLAPVTGQDWSGLLAPRVRFGVVGPGGGSLQRGADYQLYRLVPLDVLHLGVGLEIADYAAAAEAVEQRFWPAVEALLREGADCIVLSGAPVSAALGRERIVALAGEVARRHDGLPFYATLECVLEALGFLGARRLALASRFPPEVNAALGAYLRDGGVEVVTPTTRGLPLEAARRLSLEDGLRLSLEVAREAARADAEAVFVAGGAALSLHAIPAVEAEFGRPTLTNLSAEVFSALVRPGLVPPVTGWGTLLAGAPMDVA